MSKKVHSFAHIDIDIGRKTTFFTHIDKSNSNCNRSATARRRGNISDDRKKLVTLFLKNIIITD